jgi:hypothetical protein
MPKQEENLHIAICNYLKLQYPNVIFTSEASGVRMTIGQAVKLKKMRSGGKLPDLWILEPRGGYHGLFLEIKAEGILKKDGSFKTKHIEEQNDTIQDLLDKGYHATFVVGFDEAKDEIDSFMALPFFKNAGLKEVSKMMGMFK